MGKKKGGFWKKAWNSLKDQAGDAISGVNVNVDLGGRGNGGGDGGDGGKVRTGGASAAKQELADLGVAGARRKGKNKGWSGTTVAAVAGGALVAGGLIIATVWS